MWQAEKEVGQSGGPETLVTVLEPSMRAGRGGAGVCTEALWLGQRERDCTLEGSPWQKEKKEAWKESQVGGLCSGPGQKGWSLRQGWGSGPGEGV